MSEAGEGLSQLPGQPLPTNYLNIPEPGRGLYTRPPPPRRTPSALTPAHPRARPITWARRSWGVAARRGRGRASQRAEQNWEWAGPCGGGGVRGVGLWEWGKGYRRTEWGEGYLAMGEGLQDSADRDACRVRRGQQGRGAVEQLQVGCGTCLGEGGVGP